MLLRVLMNNRLLLITVFALAVPVTVPGFAMLTAVVPSAAAVLIVLVTSLN